MRLAVFSGIRNMGWKNFWSRASTWLAGQWTRREHRDFSPQIDGEGLMTESRQAETPDGGDKAGANHQLTVKKVVRKDSQGEPKAGPESLERIQAGFEKLISRLEGINQNLGRQVAQHQELMARIDQIPKLIENWPKVIENQNQLTEQLFEQLKANITKDQQLLDAVEKIPTETAKQTDAMVEINHQLAAAADTDVQMVESFNKFNETLERLNRTTDGHKDSIIQMSKTFAASDRYLKYIMTRQNRRFWWIFLTAVGVCLFVILVFTGIIIYLGR